MDKEIIIKRVKAKLAEKEVESGVKDWLGGALIAFSSIFGNIDKAVATPLDLDKFLTQSDKKVKVNKDLKNIVKIDKYFKPMGGGDGRGAFNIKIGPFTINGNYYKVEGYSQLESNSTVNSKAPKEEIEKWKPYVLDFLSDIEESFDRIEGQAKKEKKQEKKQEKEQEKEKPESYSEIKDKNQKNWENNEKRNEDIWKEHSKDTDRAWKEYQKSLR